LITGAGRGLGLCLAWLFMEKGFTVFAGQYQVTEGLAALVGKGRPDLHLVPLDVTDERSVEVGAGTVGSLCSGLDVLINNAAVCEDEGGKIEQVDFDCVARILNVNTIGPLRVTRAFLPLLRAGGMKTIVNMSSEAGSIAACWRKGMFGYSMSKAALNMQSKLLHNYLADDGFRVLALHPGWMKTDMGGKNADIEPEEAAQGIFSIVFGQALSPSMIYCDYRGHPLEY
jgi:NAD(P)-dependent dehydrogenase (short-subunit alcohol dehydrogenase family)